MSGDEIEVEETFENEIEMSEEESSDKELTEEELALMAEKLKEQGNVFYKNKDYEQALEFYTTAINSCPAQASYYGNRAAAYMMLNKYQDALEDARKSVSIDPAFAKGYLREGKCHIALGEPAAALNSYNKVLTLEPNNNAVRSELKLIKSVKDSEEMADRNFIKGDFRAAAYYLGKCIENSPACTRFKIRRAEALALNGKYQDSQEIVNDILRMDSLNADAIYVRGMCLYYQDNVEKAFQHFQHVFRLAPDHQKAKDIYKKAKHLMAKKEAGNTAFRTGKYEEAITLYTEALSIDANNKITNSKLYCNRATVCSKVGKNEQAVEDCTKAIELDDTYLKAYLRRAKCYMDMEQYEEAVRNYEKICGMDKTRENKQLLQEAKLELKKSKRKDYYKILGVSKTATEDEMKKAYRKRALIHHPDRHSHAEPDVQKEEERKFKEVGEAYAILSDQKKRSRYDSGQDLEEMSSGGFGANFDPNEIFYQFFGGGGGGGFQRAGGHGGGFPGGFSFQFG